MKMKAISTKSGLRTMLQFRMMCLIRQVRIAKLSLEIHLHTTERLQPMKREHFLNSTNWTLTTPVPTAPCNRPMPGMSVQRNTYPACETSNRCTARHPDTGEAGGSSPRTNKSVPFTGLISRTKGRKECTFGFKLFLVQCDQMLSVGCGVLWWPLSSKWWKV